MGDGYVRGLDKLRPNNQSAYEILEGLITTEAARGKKIFLTGHSLGGATAGIFAQLLASRSAERIFVLQAHVDFSIA